MLSTCDFPLSRVISRSLKCGTNGGILALCGTSCGTDFPRDSAFTWYLSQGTPTTALTQTTSTLYKLLQPRLGKNRRKSLAIRLRVVRHAN